MGGRRAGQLEPSNDGRCAWPARLSGPRDSQRSRVYTWENRVVAPRDPTTVAFAAAQAMVDAIWSDMDIQYPPAVERLPRHASATIARANRLSLFLSDLTPAWCLLHEIAHAMTTTADGSSDGHGPIFMEIYLRLLVRYLRFDEMEMRLLLQDAGIKVARNSRPVFLDR